jgi:hypothetical protein
MNAFAGWLKSLGIGGAHRSSVVRAIAEKVCRKTCCIHVDISIVMAILQWCGGAGELMDPRKLRRSRI